MAHLDWTFEQRTVLHLLRTRFTFTHEENAAIFNRIFADALRHAGYTNGLDVTRLRDEYDSRDFAGRAKVWKKITAGTQSVKEEETRTELVDIIEEHTTALGLGDTAPDETQIEDEDESLGESNVSSSDALPTPELAVVGEGISALAGRGIYVPVKVKGKKRANPPSEVPVDPTRGESNDDAPLPTKRVRELLGSGERKPRVPSAGGSIQHVETATAPKSGKGKEPVRNDDEMSDGDTSDDAQNAQEYYTYLSSNYVDGIWLSGGLRGGADPDKGFRAGVYGPLDDDDEEPSTKSQDGAGVSPTADLTAPAPQQNVAKAPGTVGTGSDGAPLFGTTYVDDNPDRIWHSRGGGRWAEGVPPGNMRTDKKKLGKMRHSKTAYKVAVRIPTNIITAPGADDFINKEHDADGYWTITGAQIDAILADPSNIQFDRPQRAGGLASEGSEAERDLSSSASGSRAPWGFGNRCFVGQGFKNRHPELAYRQCNNGMFVIVAKEETEQMDVDE